MSDELFNPLTRPAEPPVELADSAAPTLASWMLQKKPLPDPLGLARQLAHAVADLHKNGKVHGHLRADAVLLCARPTSSGSASGPGSGSSGMRTGIIARLASPASPAFASPAGAAAISLAPAADVADLGRLLLAITGLHDGADDVASAPTMQQVGTERIGPLSLFIQRMISPDPARRPSMEEVAQELDHFAEHFADPAPQKSLASADTPDASGVVSPGERIGQQIGSYKLVRQIGAGGMGEVFEAQHARLSRRAAIKLLRGELSLKPDMVRRFFTEAESVNVVQHPGIVSIFEFGQLPDRTVFIVMEFLAGESLGQRLHRAGGRLGLDALPLMRQIASALAAAHAHNIIHRDLKPENIMIVADPDVPGGERTKLVDFGIAKMAAETQADRLGDVTQAGAMMGTPAYMSPEQIRDTGAVDDRADVYSLGVMLYQAVGGKLPFSAASFYELATLHFNSPPPPLRELDDTLPEPLCALIERMLAKQAQDRPSMQEVAQQLEVLMGGSASGRSLGRTAAMAALSQGEGDAAPRRSVLGVFASLGAAAVGGVLAFLLWHRPPAPAPVTPHGTTELATRPPPAPPPPIDLPGLREQSIGVIEEGLRDTESLLRKRAVTVLGQSRDVRIAPLGEPLLGDQDPGVQGQAAEALGALGARAAVPALLEAAQKRELSDVLKAQLGGALQELGEPSAEKLLRHALRSKEEQARDRAALFLAVRGDKKARQALLEGPVDDQHEDQVAVLGRLARFGDQEALAVLQHNLMAPAQVPDPASGSAPAKDDDSGLQLHIAEELARIGDGDGNDSDNKARHLLEAVARGQGRNRLRAARILARLDDPSFYDLFSQRFADPSADLSERIVAAEGLGATGRRAGAAILGAALPKDGGNALRLRLAAAGGILQIVASDPTLLSQEGLARIQQRLGDPSWNERAVAASALGDADPKLAVPLLAQGIKDDHAEVRESAARALGHTGVSAAVPVLSGVLSDRAPVVRREAITSIGQVGERMRQRGEPVDEVLKTMADHAEQGDVRERVASLATLARLGDDSHGEQLSKWLHAGDAEVRAQAIEAAALNPATDPQVFVEALADRSFGVRFAAASALSQRGKKDGVTVLREGLGRPGHEALLARGKLLHLGEAVDGKPTLTPGPVPERVLQVEAAALLPVGEALGLLFQAARDAAMAVRIKVIEVLGSNPALREPALGRRLLRGLLGDPEPMVRAHAGLVYGKLDDKPAANANAAAEPTPEPVPVPAATPDLATPQSETREEVKHGHLEIEAEADVRFQIDHRGGQVTPVKPVSVAPGKHRVSFSGGAIEIEVPPGETVTVRLPVTQGEQALSDGVAAFEAGDLAKAQEELARARARLRGKLSKAQWYNLLYYQGRIHEGQGHWADAMGEYDKLADKIPAEQQSAEQRAQVKDAVARAAAHLGRIEVSEPVDGKCQTKALWLPPGAHELDVGDKSREIRVRAGETLKVQACP